MSQLNIKNMWIQQTKINQENTLEPMEVRVTNVKVKLNEEETRICEGIIKRIQENSKRIREIDIENTEEVPNYTRGINEIMEEIMSNEMEINEEDTKNMEKVNETIRQYGNSFIREIYEEIIKEGKKGENNENNENYEEIQENNDKDDQREINDENSSEELSELEDEPPRVNRKRRHEDELQRIRKRSKLERKSKKIEELIQELETSIYEVISEEELSENETEEDMEQNDIRILIRMFHGIEKVNKEQIRKWFEYGRRFEQQVEETKNQSKKRITDQTARGKVYEEMRRKMVGNTTKEAIRKRTQGCIKIYELFMEIGKEKMNKIKDYSVKTLVRLTKEEIKQIKDHFRRK